MLPVVLFCGVQLHAVARGVDSRLNGRVEGTFCFFSMPVYRLSLLLGILRSWRSLFPDQVERFWIFYVTKESRSCLNIQVYQAC